jgi:hypothetical protein
MAAVAVLDEDGTDLLLEELDVLGEELGGGGVLRRSGAEGQEQKGRGSHLLWYGAPRARDSESAQLRVFRPG